jgi:eukaryotic-like serine/threonine-protein kinase
MKKIGSNIELVEKLNEGGTAIVHLGVNTWTGFPVAVKELKKNFFKSDFVREKFKAEANKYLYLNHPNIVKLHDFIEEGDSHYLVMELIEGFNLNEYQNKVTGPMPISMAALLISETLKALAHAHQQGVVHLDIKPSNIMLSNKEEIKVLDFGISQDTKEGQSEKLLGTPSYMSPEQISSEKIDHRSDIYAVGITLFELITGRTPFVNSENREALFKAIKNDPVPTILGSPVINAIIQKATAKNKENRYQSCDEFFNDLIAVI